MAFFFRKQENGNSLSVREATRQMVSLQSPPNTAAAQEECTKSLTILKVMLQGTFDKNPHPGQVEEIINSMIQEDFFYILTRTMHLLNFLGRKDAQSIFSQAFRYRPEFSTDEATPAILHVVEHRTEVVIELCRSYEHKESASQCGTVLREILKFPNIIAIILYDQSIANEPAIKTADIDEHAVQSGEGVFWKFFECIDQATFEVSADAFTTFRDILTKDKPLTSHYLSVNFDLFFERYNRVLVNSSSYVTKRQSIKLLGEILLDRTNYNVMTAYVDKGEHLKICMNLLRDERKMVQYEGFHVFKVFVANPNKSEAVTKILRQNRERLLKFLPAFLEDRTEDDQFMDEKAFLIRQIDQMPTLQMSI